uniref:Uncharacterized protein n=1 Tax=Spironucleus salmonicida TaxID=348837 RepID=V6LQ66_9EUKA|eukprot:EST45856.1 Hypothetical protein SS50377_14198 [Spironucleus salmonicida]
MGLSAKHAAMATSSQMMANAQKRTCASKTRTAPLGVSAVPGRSASRATPAA